MEINHVQKEGKGAFFVGNVGEPLAEMTYTLPGPGKMIIQHTEVSDELRGQRVGYDLVEAAVNYARDHQLKIIPLCPFANAVFKKRKELADVLYTQN